MAALKIEASANGTQPGNGESLARFRCDILMGYCRGKATDLVIFAVWACANLSGRFSVLGILSKSGAHRTMKLPSRLVTGSHACLSFHCHMQQLVLINI
jgi:hypothetical protein